MVMVLTRRKCTENSNSRDGLLRRRQRKADHMKYVSMTILAATLPLAGLRADDAVPKRADFTKYQVMLERSPFAVATASALPAPALSAFKDLYVANAARSPDDDL